MTLRRILIFAGVLLILFLGMYSWNQRTRTLDDLAANIGLELSGAVLFLLCDEAASFITGVVLPIDGGFSAYSGV